MIFHNEAIDLPIENLVKRGERLFAQIDNYVLNDPDAIQVLADELLKTVDQCPSTLANRVVGLLIDISEAGYIYDGDAFLNILDPTDKCLFYKLKAISYNQRGDRNNELAARKKAIDYAQTDEQIAEAQTRSARLLHVDGNLDKAAEWIHFASAHSEIPFDLRYYINVVHAPICGLSWLHALKKFCRYSFRTSTTKISSPCPNFNFNGFSDLLGSRQSARTTTFESGGPSFSQRLRTYLDKI